MQTADMAVLSLTAKLRISYFDSRLRRTIFPWLIAPSASAEAADAGPAYKLLPYHILYRDGRLLVREVSVRTTIEDISSKTIIDLS